MKIQILSSYNPQAGDVELRFGYKGLLYGINEVTGVYFLGIAYTYREIFYFKKKKYFLLILLLGASFLTGAKGCLIAFLLLTLFYLARYRTVIFVLLALPIVIKGLTYLNDKTIDMLKEAGNINFDSSSIITLLLTGRDLFVIRNFNYMASNWNILNYLFGDGILYSESDLFDLYYIFGIGAVVYLFMYLRTAFRIDKSPDSKYIIMLLLLMAFTGGHLIRSGVFPVFFVLYLVTSNSKMIAAKFLNDSVVNI